MNRIIIRSILLLSAAGLLFFILLKGSSPFGKKNSSFASEPRNEITKIEFSEGERKLSLTKEGSNWFVNGKIEARKSGIFFILKILQELKIKSPVSAELFESEIDMKKIVPVKVKVYEKRKLLKSFLVYKTQSNNFGNIMKIREGSKPFIVYVPDSESEIGSGFTTNELFWQSYLVFNMMPSEIARVNFENFSDSASSFTIVNNNRHFVLSNDTRVLTGWDSTLVTRYLSYFTRIPFESWAFDIEADEKKSLEAQQPLYKLTLLTTSGTTTTLTLWERMKSENGAKTKDTDRLYGKTQSSAEFFIMKYFDIDPLLKKRSYFFTE